MGALALLATVAVLGNTVLSANGQPFVPPIIDAGTPSDLPLEIDRENMNEKIGSTLHIVQGQSAMIQCSISAGTGLPIDSVNYTWYYMGMQIINGSKFMITVDDSRRSSTLMVNNFQRADNGQLTCVAFNPAGQSQESTEVFVYSDVLIDKGDFSVEIGPGGFLNGTVGDKFLVPIGRRAFINCDLADVGGFPYNSSANPPLPVSRQWFKDGRSVDLRLFDNSNLETRNQLIVDVGSFFDIGNYECRVTSRIVNERAGDYRIFQTDSGTSNVMVLSQPMIMQGVLPDPFPGQKGVAVGTGQTCVVSIGTNVNIRCELVSATMPPSTISWVKVSGGVREPISDDGSKFIITSNDRESELVISAFDNNDVGTYHCIAANSAGNDTALVHLDLCPPEAQPCPLDADPSFFNVSVQIAEGLNDTCTYCATWQVTDYGPCSKTCQGGKQTRNVTCIELRTGASMPDSACPARPITERPCNEGVICTPPVIRGGVLPDPTPGQKGVAVGGPTRVISSGTNVNIRCELVSATMPESAISWVKVSGGVREPISDDGSKFIITSNDRESELVISAFDNKDVGTYHCIAENSVGSDTALIRLDLCPPEAQPCPLDADPSFFNVSVQITEGLNDTCTYCATWQVSQYGPCSETCQDGKQTRNVKCVVPRTGATMPDSACPARPITERPCNEGVVCGCFDGNHACKSVNAIWCKFEVIKKKCCATCSA